MLPEDLIAHLSDAANRSLTLSDGEIRELTYYAPDDAPLKTFEVDSYQLHNEGLLDHDPEEQRKFSGYDLIATCNAYDPEGILIWFPEWSRYGSWDCDHLSIITYPDVTWTQIAADPTWYVNGQWYPEKVKHERVNPWMS